MMALTAPQVRQASPVPQPEGGEPRLAAVEQLTGAQPEQLSRPACADEVAESPVAKNNLPLLVQDHHQVRHAIEQAGKAGEVAEVGRLPGNLRGGLSLERSMEGLRLPWGHEVHDAVECPGYLSYPTRPVEHDSYQGPQSYGLPRVI